MIKTVHYKQHMNKLTVNDIKQLRFAQSFFPLRPDMLQSIATSSFIKNFKIRRTVSSTFRPPMSRSIFSCEDMNTMQHI